MRSTLEKRSSRHGAEDRRQDKRDAQSRIVKLFAAKFRARL
jgi:hypothetical protein